MVVRVSVPNDWSRRFVLIAVFNALFHHSIHFPKSGIDIASEVSSSFGFSLLHGC